MHRILFTMATMFFFTSLVFAQGTETFANFPETGNQYKDGTFTGQDGSTWTYTQCRGDIQITNETPTLGRDRSPLAEIKSGTIAGGIGTLRFDYMQAFSTNVNLEIYVNNVLVGTVTSNGEQNVVKSSGDIQVNQVGDFTLRFAQPSGAGQVAIDNVTWTAYSIGTIDPEPSNHATDFVADSVSFDKVYLSWTGATGTQLPHKYLLLGKTGSATFPVVQDSFPIADDSDWSDGVAAVNVAHLDGKNTYAFTGLEQNTSYTFRIYPYTNSGADINYKTDGTIPEVSATTSEQNILAISELRMNFTNYQGNSVKVGGTVTAVNSGYGFFIQDAAAAWSGIYVYDPDQAGNVAMGDSVLLTGTADKYYELNQVKNLTELTVISSGNALPDPVTVTTGNFPQEQYESVLVTIREAQCTNPDLGYGEWEINDGSGPCRVDDLMFPFTPDSGATYTITGVGYHSFGNYKLEPRSDQDIHLVTDAPVITQLGLSSRVPFADQDFVDTVKVTGKNSITNVELRYRVNEGDMQSVTMITAGNDSTFTATIPASAYSDGNRVDYWVFAEDNQGKSTEGEHSYFFAGLTPILSLKQLDQNNAILYDGYYARTSGVATVANGVFDANHLSVYIQDEAYGGINVFRYDAASREITPGHSYTVVGQLGQYNGLIQITPDDAQTDITDNGEATLPDPFEINIATLLSGAESFEGLLIKINKVDTLFGGDAWPASGMNANMLITDDGGTNRLTLRIDKDTGIPDNAEPVWPQNIIGLFTQYDFDAPYDEGYQILPRSMDDFSDATAIDDEHAFLPVTLKLYSAYPNPFNPTTTLRFDMPADLAAGKIELAVYNSLGQKVKVLTRNASVGRNTVSWKGVNEQGNNVASGVYYAVLRAGHRQVVTKLLLIR
ncbi:MAG TPA: T9SS type A sorting domain-containing protein [Caldithrix abyssi]|uniref:T9SS type A sorting domain-containing protein n=1 Tax=Caldithrix abyssi TaxID=187145 RepID=A0A7V4TZM3_CALAY|nr:T9SS type A sorting domain-containing protein [Caldithrix abyssi]